ncbi:hypothetical protein [Candidatus Poriferisodalis sp.]|uniref:hypothetical protein n=1 Tax=Candidatus Poriferisodalis sp. TaxID=3101277 RepID=UPI003B01782F
MPTTASDDALTDALRQRLTVGENVQSEHEAPMVIVAQSFIDSLARQSGHKYTTVIDDETARRMGSTAAEQVMAVAAWEAAIGDRLDTTQVRELLGISRQALAKRQRSGSLIALEGQRTSWYPVWQFDREQRRVRPIVADIIAAFGEYLDEADPVVIAAWATTPQLDLGDRTPAQWIADANDDEQLTRAARRAAVRLAQ